MEKDISGKYFKKIKSYVSTPPKYSLGKISKTSFWLKKGKLIEIGVKNDGQL